MRPLYLRARSLLRRKPWLQQLALLVLASSSVVFSLIVGDPIGSTIGAVVIGYCLRALAFDRFYRQSLVNFARMRRAGLRWRRASKLWQANYHALAEFNIRLLASTDERPLH